MTAVSVIIDVPIELWPHGSQQITAESAHNQSRTCMEATREDYRPQLAIAIPIPIIGGNASKLDKKLPVNREIASAKLYATEMLARVTDTCIQLHGGMGLMDDLPFERFWRDARVERIWDGTSEIQKHIISRELLRPLED